MTILWIVALISTLLLINAWIVEYLQSKVSPYARNSDEAMKEALVQSLKKWFFIILSSIMWAIIITC